MHRLSEENKLECDIEISEEELLKNLKELKKWQDTRY